MTGVWNTRRSFFPHTLLPGGAFFLMKITFWFFQWLFSLKLVRSQVRLALVYITFVEQDLHEYGPQTSQTVIYIGQTLGIEEVYTPFYKNFKWWNRKKWGQHYFHIMKTGCLIHYINQRLFEHLFISVVQIKHSIS